VKNSEIASARARGPGPRRLRYKPLPGGVSPSLVLVFWFYFPCQALFFSSESSYFRPRFALAFCRGPRGHAGRPRRTLGRLLVVPFALIPFFQKEPHIAFSCGFFFFRDRLIVRLSRPERHLRYALSPRNIMQAFAPFFANLVAYLPEHPAPPFSRASLLVLRFTRESKDPFATIARPHSLESPFA